MVRMLLSEVFSALVSFCAGNNSEEHARRRRLSGPPSLHKKYRRESRPADPVIAKQIPTHEFYGKLQQQPGVEIIEGYFLSTQLHVLVHAT